MTEIENSFQAIADRVETLFSEGYHAQKDAIIDVMALLHVDDIALRYFINRASYEDRYWNLRGAQSFALYASDSYTMRINLWFPRGRNSGVLHGVYERYFSVNVCHNHSFDFFTIGLFGPGYTSQFYSCDEHSHLHQPGDRIDLVKDKFFQLHPGVALFVEKGREFHTQYYPDDLSVSLNIIPKDLNSFSIHQYIVDAEKQIVETVIEAQE